MQPGEVLNPGDSSQQPTEIIGQSQVSDESVAAYEPAETQMQPQPETPAINWTASEYVDHPKDASWFMMFGIGLAAIVAFTYLMTRDPFTTVLIGIGGLGFGIFAGRRPQVQSYSLSNSGITIGNKFYPYTDFKTFSLMDEGAFQSIMLSPLKRFMPPLSIYFDPKDQDVITRTLTDYLPFEQRKHDPIDQLMRRLRF